MISSNAHTHTVFCDGQNTAEEMVQAALQNGFTSLGFSGHSYYEGCMHYCMSPENTKAYEAEIRRLQTAYADQLTLHLGLELDYYSQVDLTPYSYLIGSVHHILDPATGEFYTVDGSVSSFQHLLQQGFGGNVFALARAYYELVTEVMTQPRNGRRPDIVGHFNLLTKRNADHHLIDEDDPAYQKIAYDALRAIARTDAIFEVNTGAIARGYAPQPYPNLAMLKLLKELNARVMVNSDCHNAAHLSFGFDLARELLLTAGFRSVWQLGTQSLWEEVGL